MYSEDRKTGASVARRAHAITRDLHLHVGLFLSPFVLLLAAGVILLNHPGIPAGDLNGYQVRTARVTVPPGLERLRGMERVRGVQPILRASGVSGEVGPKDLDTQVLRPLPGTIAGDPGSLESR